MSFQALVCPSCGGPLPAEARFQVVVCKFCRASISPDEDRVHAAQFRKALQALDTEVPGPHVFLCGLPYRVLDHLGSGASCEVFLAQRARRLTERVRLKVLRARTDTDLLARETQTLLALQRGTADGSDHFSQRVPEVVASGVLVGAPGGNTPALALRYPPGFGPSVLDVLQAFPQGVDPRHGVWMWRRLLEVLGWIHQSGWVHGALLPEHLLVHSRDHGVLLLGWSAAQQVGKPETPLVRLGAEDYYPSSLLQGNPPSYATDLAQAARCILRLLGGHPSDGTAPARVPRPLAELLISQARLPIADSSSAHSLHQQVAATAKQVFGPPTFVPFVMP